MKKIILVFIVATNFLFSQDKQDIKVDYSGFMETFYTYNFNQPTTQQAVPFLYNYNQQNEFNLNIVLLRAKVYYSNFYASIALQSGTYVVDNYANENTKIINEAFIGTYLDKNQKTNLEAGIMPSYIGFETATSASNLTLTRSILAENSPYYMTGVKLNHQLTNKISIGVNIANGWQRISKPNSKALPSFGTQLVYKPNEKSVFNWSTFIGDEPLTTNLRTRYFSDLYYDFQWKNNFRTQLGFDCGLQRNDNNGFNSWYSPVMITQYTINKKWQTAFRAEYYQDKNNVMIGSKNTFGTSLNFDFLPNSKVKLRTEAKYYNAKDLFFERNNQLVTGCFSVATALSFEF